jgi:3'(2'), 5'-bisphosphate nucleotidase|mmetsp:Transcript_7219/g.8346  ORF Transcript_7219/g.8346 Transcript_7219/m.8346 type:complete len:236 (+) Transcript_7219:41-748(+)
MGNICSGAESSSTGPRQTEIRKVAHTNISVAEFLSVCIFLGEECGKIIREVNESSDLKTASKGKDNPVTIADLKVQKTIEVCLNALYPSLCVMGEESKESIADIEPVITAAAFNEAIKESIKQEELNENQANRREWIQNTLRTYYDEDDVCIEDFETFNTADAVVWIDPLDGTSDFVKGNLSAVTVLIGLAINGRSRLGVVHNPFTEEDSEVGKTIFGSAEHGVFKLSYDRNMSQ